MPLFYDPPPLLRGEFIQVDVQHDHWTGWRRHDGSAGEHVGQPPGGNEMMPSGEPLERTARVLGPGRRAALEDLHVGEAERLQLQRRIDAVFAVVVVDQHPALRNGADTGEPVQHLHR